MKNDEKKLFRKYIKQSKYYLEFGSGGSTLEANKYINNISSIETDNKWIEKIKKINNKINFIYINIDCIWWEYVSWNNNQKLPSDKQKEYWIKYSNLKINFKPDLILIDGRFRVASLLNLYNQIDNNTIILFHDYTTRKQYHIVELFYDKIECINTLQVFKKKLNIDNNLLEEKRKEYELIID
tara:strand:- start:319 stop:867 length:549 start_codon:yes stop_codon:yes gene_type:complete